MFKHIVGGFCYHFWTKAWDAPRGKALSIEKLEDMSTASKRRVANATNAIEAFVNLAMIATGLLQLLAIEHAEAIQRRYTWWMRTYSSIIPSEEMVRTVIQHEFYHHFRKFKHTAIYRIIQRKRQPSKAGQLKKAAGDALEFLTVKILRSSPQRRPPFSIYRGTIVTRNLMVKISRCRPK
jgi:hypothetical protein